MSIYLEYIDGFVRLAEAARTDSVKDLIRARLTGRRDAVHGLVSPPLEKNEPDETAIFELIYRRLLEPPGSEPVKYLRQAASELMMEALSKQADLSVLDALGGLIADFEVRESETLADNLRNQLWGYLECRMPKPLIDIMNLEGEALARAARALDLWLALTPPQPKWLQDHHRKKLEDLFRQALDQLLERGQVGELQFYMLTLFFRALIKTSPTYAAKTALPDMARLLARAHKYAPAYRHIWYGLCWEYGVLLGSDPGWRRRFETGIETFDIAHWQSTLSPIENPSPPADAGAPTILRHSLGELGVDQALKELPPRQKVVYLAQKLAKRRA